jgi:hypothetical protein
MEPDILKKKNNWAYGMLFIIIFLKKKDNTLTLRLIFFVVEI